MAPPDVDGAGDRGRPAGPQERARLLHLRRQEEGRGRRRSTRCCPAAAARAPMDAARDPGAPGVRVPERGRAVPAGGHPALAARRRRGRDLRPGLPAVPGRALPLPGPPGRALRGGGAGAAARAATATASRPRRLLAGHGAGEEPGASTRELLHRQRGPAVPLPATASRWDALRAAAGRRGSASRTGRAAWTRRASCTRRASPRPASTWPARSRRARAEIDEQGVRVRGTGEVVQPAGAAAEHRGAAAAGRDGA